VAFDGSLAHNQSSGNFCVGEPPNQQLRHLLFALRETEILQTH